MTERRPLRGRIVSRAFDEAGPVIERTISIITTDGKPFDAERWRNKPVDALYMTRYQKERRPKPPVEVEILVPCPHCGQFQTMVMIKNE